MLAAERLWGGEEGDQQRVPPLVKLHPARSDR
jgi:hypothetical protein